MSVYGCNRCRDRGFITRDVRSWARRAGRPFDVDRCWQCGPPAGPVTSVDRLMSAGESSDPSVLRAAIWAEAGAA